MDKFWKDVGIVLVLSIVVIGLVLFLGFCTSGRANSLSPYPRFKATAGDKLFTYYTGTTTEKATYTHSGSANTNPVILDSNGEADVWLSPGKYRFVLKDSTEATTYWTRDNIEGIDVSSSGVFLVDASESDQGAAGDGYSVKDLVDSISTDQATLLFQHSSGNATTTYTFLTSETIGFTNISNITCKFERGAVLSIASGKTVTFYSPENIDAAPDQTLWGETDRVDFATGGVVHPEWWYASDWDNAIQYAYNSLPSTSGEDSGVIQMLAREYQINTKLAFTNKSVRWQGATFGRDGTDMLGTEIKLANAANVTMVEIDGSTGNGNRSYMWIDGISFNGNRDNQTTAAIDIIHLKDCWGTKITNCVIAYSERHGIYVNGTDGSNVIRIGPGNHIISNGTSGTGSGIWGGSLSDSNIINNEISWCQGSGIVIGSGNITVIGNQVDDCFVHGISVSGRGLISGNLVKNNDRAGIAIYSDYVTVTGNMCTGNGEDSLVEAADKEKSGILIAADLTSVCVVGNQCSGNATWDGGLTQNYGIYVDDGQTNFSMVGNACNGNNTADIYMADHSENSVSTTLRLVENTETMPYLIKEKVAVDCSGAATSFTIYTVPANSSFIPLTVTARVDNDIAATNGDYWSVGVDGANRRADYGVCATTAASSKHSQNAKIRWLNSSEVGNQVATAAEVIKLMSVDGTGDAAALSNAMGGTAGDQVTVIITGWLLPDLADAS